MVEIIPAARRFGFKNAWLDARWHFSFGHYRDVGNMGFGPLRVFNDDVIKGNSGFPMHDHAEMEIITYVIDGELTHADSTGGTGVLRAGDLQRMTAGHGIEHSEFNKSDKPVRLLQFWIEPAVNGLEPGYEQKTVATVPGAFTAVVAGKPRNGAMVMHQDATVYIGKFGAGQGAVQEIGAGRRAYVFVIDGEAKVNGEIVSRGDQARITGETTVKVEVAKEAHVMLIDLP
jgi:redox-sensitive bicupin YhaK (pirin superfamily)